MNSIELPADVPIPTGLALRLGASLAFHPFEYSKVLIQLGHEPLAPRNTKTMLGKPALAYPSVFQVTKQTCPEAMINNSYLSTVGISGGGMDSWACGEV